jgi:heat shock protein HslJ
MKLLNVLTVFAFSGLLLTACTTSSSSVGIVNKNKSSLYNTNWKLVEDDELVKGYNAEDVYFSIDRNEFKVTGFGGCNQFNSNVALDGNNIKFSPIASTKMLCPTSTVEDSFLNMLKDVTRYEIKENVLYFYKGNLLLLKFKNQ